MPPKRGVASTARVPCPFCGNTYLPRGLYNHRKKCQQLLTEAMSTISRNSQPQRARDTGQ
ncbi:hypothetical protein C2E23DRAFT_811005 [Lenzites betulinus]|nr:hypothetical protein C2E23DRAFT_811005 [Lenzites betulinus]